MSAVVPILTRAAIVGGLAGLGGALLWTPSDANKDNEMSERGKIFLACLVGSVALRALGYYFGALATAGMCVGGLFGCIRSQEADMKGSLLKQIGAVAGGILVGGVFGHLVAHVPAIPVVVVI